MTAAEGSSSMYEQRAATLQGALGLVAARFALSAVRLLLAAKHASGLSQRQLAERLEVTEGRVSQVINGDGNVMLATLARFMHVMGYALEIVATPTNSNGKAISIPASRRRRTSAQEEARQRVDYEIYEQQFITGHGPMVAEMYVPTDDTLGCVPYGVPRRTGKVTSAVKATSTHAPSRAIQQLASRTKAEWQTQAPARPSRVGDQL